MLSPNTTNTGRRFVTCAGPFALLAAVFFCLTSQAQEAKPATNAAPPQVHFAVESYDVSGNTLIPRAAIDRITSKHIGTNISFVDVGNAVKELQLEYHNRGYDTVNVTIPQQKLTNAIFKLRVFEGRLAEIIVQGNRFYGSNNVMRALPGLTTNMYLNSKLMQPVLDMANQNQDRQIYPEIHPGPDPETTSLILHVKDQFPMHAKLEANNASTPGTPDMRIATSLAYDNLWDLNHSMGIQYTFSEQDFKQGGSWNFYDQPQVANYSIFYRLPVGNPDSVSENSFRSGNNFGYNEATRKFELPAPTGSPDLNIYASGSTIDSGVLNGSPSLVSNTVTATNPVGTSTYKQIVQQTLTYNYAIGLRYTDPLREFLGINSHAQAGFDFKYFKQIAYSTNQTTINSVFDNPNGGGYITNPPAKVVSGLPTTTNAICYLPLMLRWDGSRPDKNGLTGMGASYSPNFWTSGSRHGLDKISDSGSSSGYWHVLTGYVSREQDLPNHWKLALKADGQWASEPLISNEQFGAGGINGVRGYREGEVFGDNGYRLTSELKFPSYRVGYVGKGTKKPLTVRSSIFMDYADTILIDPRGRKGDIPLWGTGLAGAASVGTHFNGMLSFAWPMLGTPYSEPYHVRIAFSLTAQF